MVSGEGSRGEGSGRDVGEKKKKKVLLSTARRAFPTLSPPTPTFPYAVFSFNLWHSLHRRAFLAPSRGTPCHICGLTRATPGLRGKERH